MSPLRRGSFLRALGVPDLYRSGHSISHPDLCALMRNYSVVQACLLSPLVEKKNREHTREWRERIELLELDIREVKQVAYAR